MDWRQTKGNTVCIVCVFVYMTICTAWNVQYCIIQGNVFEAHISKQAITRTKCHEIPLNPFALYSVLDCGDSPSSKQV